MTSNDTARPRNGRSLGGGSRRPADLIGALEIDTRLLGMAAALIVIWIGFHFLSGGTFLTARNLWNLSVQTAVTAIVATGMVLVIVTRNIDLSVGSVLGVLGMVMAVVQTEWLPNYLGYGHPIIWIAALVAGIVCGALIGALQGFWISYGKVPSFIVTLGGLLIWRGAAWWITSGRTVAPMDDTFQLLGGGIDGSIGAFWSWVVGGVAILYLLASTLRARQLRGRYGFPTKPVWADLLLVGAGIVAVVGFVLVMNSQYRPERTVAMEIVAELVQGAEGDGEVSAKVQDLSATFPAEAGGMIAQLPDSRADLVRLLQDWEGLPDIPQGIPIPVLIMLGVALAMNFLAGRTKFGRYVFAIGGNPDAALLAGVNTRRVILYVFMLMGVLAAIAGAVQTARLNAGANATGALLELSAIAAAVIGGTSLAGGVGTIIGALLGALVMQSLQSGMLLMNIDTPLQQIVIGLVLIAAVYIDTVYQRKRR